MEQRLGSRPTLGKTPDTSPGLSAGLGASSSGTQKTGRPEIKGTVGALDRAKL